MSHTIPSEPGESLPLEEWMGRVRAAERDGEVLAAVDLAEQGLGEHPQSIWLKHRTVLGLARAGSTEEAQARYTEYGLAGVDEEDVRALAARIAKDRALDVDGGRRQRLAAESAALYEQIFDRTQGYYPGVNAATMTLIAGDPEGARSLARRVLDVLGDGAGESYYSAVTAAEAMLLLGREEEARAALETAAVLNDGDFGAFSTTRRQLRLICAQSGLDEGILTGLAGPRVCHYCGHRISLSSGGRFPAAAEAEVARLVDEQVTALTPGYAYGALASGADILWAEALLRHGAKVHVILPFAAAEFVRSSVEDGGADWVERFHRCLEAAETVGYATDDAFLGDDELFRYGSDLAMGLALQRARYLDSHAVQLAVWDGHPSTGVAGTGADVAAWTRHGHATHVVSPPGRRVDAATAPAIPAQVGVQARVVRAILFGDIRGYSKLTDEQLPDFNDHVLGAFAAVLDRHAADVHFKNTWGDGIYVVLTDTPSAAACALDLQEAMRAVDLDAHNLPPHLALRLSGHVGPVFPVHEPVIGVDTFIGTHISRTARVEPVTPAGAVYVTEPFSASLTLAHDRHSCDYVGHLPAAKDFGRLRMYRLRG